MNKLKNALITTAAVILIALLFAGYTYLAWVTISCILHDDIMIRALGVIAAALLISTARTRYDRYRT